MASIAGTEQSLLLAVRTWLRTATGSGGAGYSEAQCDIQYDEYAAAIAPDVFVCIMSGQFDGDQVQDTSGEVNDMRLGVDITVFRRMTWIARDRKTNVYLAASSALSADCSKIIDVLSWRYAVLTTANATLAAAPYSSSYGFSEPLRFAGMDGRPRGMSAANIFDSAQEDEVCMARTIRFRGARRIVPA